MSPCRTQKAQNTSSLRSKLAMHFESSCNYKSFRSVNVQCLITDYCRGMAEVETLIKHLSKSKFYKSIVFVKLAFEDSQAHMDGNRLFREASTCFVIPYG